MNLIEMLYSWWNSLTSGTRDNIIGGLIVALIMALIAGLWGQLRQLVSQIIKRIQRNHVATPSGVKLTVPRPPRRLKAFIPRHDRDGKDIAKRIQHMLQRNQMVVLWGPGGNGKTALAIEIANRLLPGLPYGVAWINLDSLANLDLTRLLDEIAGQLSGQPGTQQLTSNSKVTATRQLLAQKRCLLVLDNFEVVAATAQEEILQFLTELDTPVLITSRKRLDRGENIHLDPMNVREGRRYIHSLVNASYKRELVKKVIPAEIIHAAEGNPLYMRWIIRQLEAGLSPGSVLAGSSRLEGDAGERIFGRSFALLEPASQQVIAALALFTAPVTPVALQHAASLSADSVKQALWQLSQLDLVVIENDRASITNLIRRLAPADSAFEAEFYLRVVTYYAETAASVDYFQDSSVYNGEYENLVGLLNWLMVHQEWHALLRLFEATGEFLTDRSGPEARLRLGQMVLQAAQQVSDEQAYAWYSVYTIGWIYLREGKLDQVLPIIRSSLSWAQAHQCQPVMALCLRSLGLVEKRQKNLKEAHSYMLNSLHLWQTLGERRWVAMTHTYLADIALQQGEYAQALLEAEEGLNIFNETKNEEGLAWVTEVLGNITERTNNLPKALDYFQISLDHRQRMQSPAGIAHTCIDLAQVELKAHQFIAAYRHAHQAYEIYNRLGTTTWIDDSQKLQADILIQFRRTQMRAYLWFLAKRLVGKLFLFRAKP